MKRFKLATLIFILVTAILYGCGKEELKTKTNENTEQKKEQIAAEEKMVLQIAKDYVTKTYGEITKNQKFEAKREKDGTYTVHVYRDLGDHNEGIAWLNVNTKTNKVIDGVH
ncbi:hypothetical protein [Bacillus sp. EAC]|uniref:hypothetical protein n=1 Tax=Bacillus sp. EAC TaxID=1978338 RepID=UPI000B434DCF|nr:hypothetical protein [Bacillus sp. EAC]